MGFVNRSNKSYVSYGSYSAYSTYKTHRVILLSKIDKKFLMRLPWATLALGRLSIRLWSLGVPRVAAYISVPDGITVPLGIIVTPSRTQQYSP
jgi:hypothetical protein